MMALTPRTYWANFKRSFGGTVAASGNVDGTFVLFENPDQTRAEDYLTLSPAVYMACRYRSQKLASVPLTFAKVGKGGKKTRVTTGSLVELLTKVNPYWTGQRLFEMTELSLCLRGKAFWALDRSGLRGEPAEIWWLHPDKVKVVRGSGAKYLKGFVYDPGYGQKPIPFAPDEMLWLRYPNPDDEFDGLAPLDAARIIADTGSAAMTSNQKMFKQGMQLAGFVSPADKADTWGKEQADDIESSLKRRFSGANNAHRWAVIKRQINFQALTLSPKDIEFVSLLKWSFEDICRVFGLSPDLLGGERTYANAAEARMAFWQDTMMPECSFFANEITEQLLPLFPGQADIAEFDLSGVDVFQELESAKWGREKEQIEAGALMLNEWRDDKGLKPLPWGDVWWGPLGVKPITDGTDPTPAPVVHEAITAPADGQDGKLPAGDQPKALTDGSPRALPRGPRTRATVAYGSREHERIWRAFTARTEPHERAFGEMCADLMRRQRRSVLDRLTGERGRRDVAEAAGDPFDKAKWIKQFRSTSHPYYLQIVQDAGDAAMMDLSLTAAFNVKDDEVRKFIRRRAQRFAEQVNDTTWQALKDALAEGIDAGESVADLAKRVDAVMGERIRSSGETIARTEVISAHNGAVIISARQSGIVTGKTWLAALDDRTRDTHISAHGQSVGLEEDFSVGDGTGPGPGLIDLPEESINCRCSLTWILDTEG